MYVELVVEPVAFTADATPLAEAQVHGGCMLTSVIVYVLARSTERPAHNAFLRNFTDWLSTWVLHLPGSWTKDGKLTTFGDLHELVFVLGHDVLFLHLEVEGKAGTS